MDEEVEALVSSFSQRSFKSEEVFLRLKRVINEHCNNKIFQTKLPNLTFDSKIGVVCGPGYLNSVFKARTIHFVSNVIVCHILFVIEYLYREINLVSV